MMRFTPKDILIFLVIMWGAYFVFYPDKPQTNDFPIKITHNKPIKPSTPQRRNKETKLPKKTENIVTISTKVDRPSVNDIPEVTPINEGHISFSTSANVAPANVAPANNVGRRTVKKKYRKTSSTDDIVIKKRQLMEDYAHDKISRAEFERQMIALRKEVALSPSKSTVSHSEYAQRRQKERLEEKRYLAYLKECIKEQLPANYREIDSKIIFAVNRDGSLAHATIWPGSQAESQSGSFGASQKDKLLVVLEKAAPFQPFPAVVTSSDNTYSMALHNGRFYLYEFRGAAPAPEIKYTPSNKPRNPKRVEDVKVTEAEIFLLGLDENENVVSRRRIPEGDYYWQPVESQNNEVAIRCILSNGKLIKSVFTMKSEVNEANEAALDTMYSLTLPRSWDYDKYPIVRLEGKFLVK